MKNQRIKQITNHLKSHKKRMVGRSILTLIAVATLYGLYTAGTTLVLNLQAVHSIKVKTSALYSSELEAMLSEIVAQADQALKSRSISLEALCSSLKNASPLIQNIEWKNNGQGSAVITIAGDEPLCLINESSIITKNSLITDVKNFETYPLAKLPKITTAKTIKPDDTVLELKTLASTVPEKLLENYTLYYKGNNEVYLQEKNSPNNFVAIATSNQLQNMELIKQAKQLSLRDEYLQKGSKKRARPYAFDVRFKNRIIAKPFHTKLKEL